MTGLSRRNSRAHSIVSDDTQLTPRPSPAPPPTRRSGTRGVRTATTASDAEPSTEAVQPTRIPPHYFLPPTNPSPFSGTLDASLDAVLQWGSLHVATKKVKEELLKDVRNSTNWPEMLDSTIGAASRLDHTISRLLLEEFVFLVTRTLLPEQIAENRLAMGRLYDKKKQLAIRLLLRYDMLREWCLSDGPVGKRDMSVASLPPPTRSEAVESARPVASPMRGMEADAVEEGYKRRALMPNVWPTLIAAPEGGFTTYGVRERMKHYITPLDNYLLLSDAEVAGWSDKWLVVRASQIVLQWQWLRQKNETLDEMECKGWRELEGKAEECEWIAEKKDGWVAKGGRGGEEDT